MKNLFALFNRYLSILMLTHTKNNESIEIKYNFDMVIKLNQIHNKNIIP